MVPRRRKDPARIRTSLDFIWTTLIPSKMNDDIPTLLSWCNAVTFDITDAPPLLLIFLSYTLEKLM